MSSAVFARSPISLSKAQASLPQLVCGGTPILHMETALRELASRSGPPGAMDDLDYFLARPQIRKKKPCLVSLAQETEPSNVEPGRLDAAVLLYEHHIAGHGIQIFATDDTTGKRTLVSAASQRAAFALLACHKLMLQGAQIILISFRHDGEQIDAALEGLLQDRSYSCRWASREREVAGYLPFESTLEATLALIGTRTRRDLRYYRRRAETQLGGVFVPDAKISREDFIALNRISSYPVTDEVAGWRYDSLSGLKSPLLYGIRDRDGHWLSLIGGRHYDCNMELYWQMNRTDIPSHSLGTAMRAYLIEHEFALGTRRLYIEGGTTHSMSHAFVKEKSTDLIVIRQSPVARVIPSLVKRFLPPENMLLKVLEDTTLEWRLVKKS